MIEVKRVHLCKPRGTKETPYVMTSPQYATTTAGQQKLAAGPRIVLYINSERNLADAAYCDTSPATQPAMEADGEIHRVAALCDGPRLIDVTTRNVRGAHIQNEGMLSIVKSIKRRLLFGLRAGDGVVPAEYGND